MSKANKSDQNALIPIPLESVRDPIQTEDRWRLAFESTGDGTWELEMGTNRYFISKESGLMLGYTKEDILEIGEEWSGLAHPDDLPIALEAMKKYLAGEAPLYSCEYRMRCKDSSYKWILARGKKFPSSVAGMPDRILGTHKDIQANHQRLEEIQRLAEMQSGILHNSFYAIITTGPEGLITSFNPAAERMLGYTADEVIGKATPALWHEVREVVARAEKFSLELGTTIVPGFEVFAVKARSNLPNEYEWTYIRKDGGRIPVQLSISALRNWDGIVSGYLGMAMDLTERKKADEEAWERNEALSRALIKVENQKFALDQHAIVAITNIKGVITYANDKFCSISKYSREEIIGNDHRLINSGYHTKDFFREMYRTIHAGKVWHGEIKNHAKDGSHYWVDTTIVPTKDDEGNLHEFIAIRTDITDRKRSEEILKERQVILDATTESHAGVVMACFDLDYNFLNFNSRQKQAIEHLFGKKISVGSNFLEIITDEGIRNVAKRDLDRCFAGESHENIVEYQGTCWQTRYSPLINDRGEIFGASYFSEDISGRKAAESRQAKQAERLSLACNAGGIGIWEYDIVNNGLVWDGQMYALYGITPDTFSGGYEAWRNGLHPEDMQRSEAELQGAIGGKKDFNTEFRVVWPDGSIRHIRALARVMHDAAGKATHMIGTNWDITERKQAEVLLNDAVKTAEDSNRSKSEFLSNMSHELRTPLNSVIGFSNILLKNKAGNLKDQDLTFLGRIVDNGKHLLQLINSVLDLSKIEAGRMELEISEFEVGKMAREVLDQFETQVRSSDVRLVLVAPERITPLNADALKFKQVLMNLVGNALKFTETGTVTIRIVTDTRSGMPLKLEVADTGIGIPAGRLGTIFGAFQQADNSISRRFGGTGLGLTISRSMLTLMGYKLRVASEEGYGTVFTIHFRDPGIETAASTSWTSVKDMRTPSGEPLSMGVLPLQGKKVLIIDDEADSCVLLRNYLEEYGCIVEEASSGTSGIQAARSFRPDMITLDLMMPDEDGWNVARKLNADPDLRGIPILIVSIVASEIRGETMGILGAIEKPVSRDSLLKALIGGMAQSN